MNHFHKIPHPVRDALSVAVIMFLLLSSCHRNNDSLIGRWTVEKVNVAFDENIASPEMVKQLGEMEKGNVIEIGNDSTMMFISDGDTLKGKCALRGSQLFCDGRLFGLINEGTLVTETSTPIGKMSVYYKKGN